MGAKDVTEVFERFFLDIIGNVVPGLALILGVWLLLDHTALPDTFPLLPPKDAYTWLIVIFGGYVAGHALSSVGECIVVRIVDEWLPRLTESVAKLPGVRFVVRLVARNVHGQQQRRKRIVPELELMERIAKSANFRAMVEQAGKAFPWLKSEDDVRANVRSWRALALSIAQDSSYIPYRFMYVSLLNLGMVTVSWFLILLWPVLRLFSAGIAINPIALVAMFLTSLAFLERRYEFYRRAMEVPFAMAVVRLSRNRW